MGQLRHTLFGESLDLLDDFEFRGFDIASRLSGNSALIEYQLFIKLLTPFWHQ